MTQTIVNEEQVHVIAYGDLLIPLGATLKRKTDAAPTGAVVDLTGLTVKFYLYNRDTDGGNGTVVLDGVTAGVTVTSAAAGQVQYDFQTAPAIGSYNAYFKAFSGSETDRFPVDTGRLIVEVQE